MTGNIHRRLPRLVDRAVGRRGREHWQAYRDFNAEFVDELQAMITVKAFNATRRHRQALLDRALALYRLTMRHMAVSLVDSGLTAFGQGVGAALAVGVGALRVIDGSLDLPSLFLVLVLVNEAFRPFRELTGYWHAGYLGIAASGAIADILTAVPGVRDRPGAVRLERTPQPPSIAFDAVTFRYETRDGPALADVSFAVAPGETVALVGRSGAGKSTVAALLLRFFDPDSGRIRTELVDRRGDYARLITAQGDPR